MLDPHFVILASLFNLFGSAVYTYRTLRGDTQPNRITWLLWAIIPMIGLAAQLQEGVGWPALMTFMIGFGPAVVFASSFVNKKAFWKISKLDIACGALSVVALLAWKISGHGGVAIAFSVLADALAGAPTVFKAWNNPSSEHYSPYLASCFSAAITLMTINNWNFATYSFPVYIMFNGILLSSIIFFRQAKLSPLSKLQ